MKLTLQIWRQKSLRAPGHFIKYQMADLSPNMSFLEMLDAINEQLTLKGEEPIAFEHDCREGICGACSLMINGEPHGPETGVASCQTYLRNFQDGDTIVIEPFRARSFPVLKDLVIDRSAFDRIIQAGGFISVNTGSAPEANTISVPKTTSDSAFDAAACIACGACVAACKNSSAMLFVAAKISHLGLLPQGQPERSQRVLKMVAQMDKEGFGNCSNTYACEAACPKVFSVNYIARMNRDYALATLKNDH